MKRLGSFTLAHVLVGKPVPAFPGHALAFAVANSLPNS
jgi:hypothetical protein